MRTKLDRDKKIRYRERERENEHQCHGGERERAVSEGMIKKILERK